MMLLFTFGVLLAGVVVASPSCKCTPNDPCWPSPVDFAALNKTVGGNLIRGTPPGSVCYPDQPDYNPERCTFVLENWFDSEFHANDPVSIGFPKFAGNPCPPIYPNGTSVTGGTATSGCSLGGYSAYVLNATRVEDIQAIVRFASGRDIRLNVKSTGHSVEGRSAAADSISIWTHHLHSNEFHEAFRPESCPPSYPSHMAVSLGAGARVREVYEFAYQHNAVVVGGSAEDVGIVGWFTGGGHGPLTSRYGQGSDNVLQVTIVTPDGEVVIANECQNPDLFWAIRGGGGGTFGVITQVTMRAYPSPSAVAHRLEVVAPEGENDDGAAFWNTVAGVYSLLPELKRHGFAGNIFMDRPPLVPRHSLWWNMNLLSAESGSLSAKDATREAERALAPLIAYLDSKSAAISYTSKLIFFPHWFQSWNQSVRTEPGAVAASGIAMASRLIPESVLVNISSSPAHLNSSFNTRSPWEFTLPEQSSLASTLQAISESVTGFQAHLAIYNPSPISSFISNGTSLPSYWRSTPLQFFTVTIYPDDVAAEEEYAVFESVRNGVGRVLKELAPDTGAYFNEGDPFDPDWRRTYFGGGEHYEALRRVKDEVDPQGILWCVACVGSEGWSVQRGSLCRA
ncbi:hypothetical protein BJX65DRAFT_316005 [Aspergillus insuetus]